MTDLTGKTVVVTGASKGIGAAAVAAIGAAGAHVVAHYGSDRAGAEAAAADLPPERRLLLQADFGDLAAVEGFWAEAQAWRGRIDVLVSNAAVMRADGGFSVSPERWDAVWDEAVRVNLLAPARLLRAAVASWRGHGGVLITMSSWVVQRGTADPDAIAYAATKAAITTATKTVARAYAKDGILAYCIAPGVVRTRMSEDAAAALGGEAAVTASLAMGEWVPPAELADLVVFLASGRCRHLTGATLDVNGASYMR